MCHSAGNRSLLIIYKTPLIISFKFIEDGAEVERFKAMEIR